MSRYTNYAIKNNVFGTLSAPVSSLATTIQLDTGQGARFTADMLATLEHIEGNKVTKREIVLITNVSSDTLTVVRKYAACPSSDDANTQSQTSFSFDTSDTINVYIPKEILDLINNGIKFLETQGTDRMRVLEAASGTPLAIDIMPGNFRCADDNIVYAGATDQLLTDNATNYIMIDGTGTLQITTTDRDTRYTRLAKVTCASWEITEIQDRRLDTIWGNLWGLQIHSLTEKLVPLPADELVIADSTDSFNNKRITYANLAPSSIVILATLWESLTAWNWQGAVYFGADGKVYGSDVAWHNYCDWIILDSGNTGDSVRMVIGWFVPDTSLTGTSDTVHLAYTSWTTDTWYWDYIQYVFKNSWITDYSGALVSINWEYTMMYPTTRLSGYERPYITKLYWKSISSISETYSWSWAVFSKTIYYTTGLKWQYWDNINYSISGCELGKKVPWWFIFNPKPKEILIWLWFYFVSSQSWIQYSNTVQAKYDWHKKYAMLTTNPQEVFGWLSVIQESIDNTNWGIVSMPSYKTDTSGTSVIVFDFDVKAGRYYRTQIYHYWQTSWGGIFNN